MSTFSEFYLAEDGYPDDIFTGPHSNIFNCTICLQVMKDSVKCPNEHYACRSCLKSSVRSVGNHCPTCRVELPSQMRSAIFSNDVINELAVKCYTARDKTELRSSINPRLLSSSSSTSRLCSWTGQLKHLEEHMVKCEFVVEKCNFHGCNIRMQRHQLADHAKICDHRPCSVKLRFNKEAFVLIIVILCVVIVGRQHTAK